MLIKRILYYYDNIIMYFCNSILKYNLEVLYHDDIYLHSLVIGQSHPVLCCSCLQWDAVAYNAMACSCLQCHGLVCYYKANGSISSNNEVTSCTFLVVFTPLYSIKLNLVRRRFNLSDVSKTELLCQSDKVARYAAVL